MSWRSAGLGLAISAIAIWLTLRSVNPGEVWQAFLAANLWLFLPVLLLLLLNVVLRAWRWKLLFLPQDQVRIVQAYAATHLSYLFSALLPGRLGELVRGFLVVESEEVSPGRALGTIFVEKLLDIAMLLLLLAGLLGLSSWRNWSSTNGTPLPGWAETNAIAIPSWAQAAGITALAIFGSIALTFVIMSWARHQAVGAVRRWIDPLPLLRRLQPSHLVATALGSADGLSRPRLLAAVLLISVVMWVGGGFTLVVALNAFHLPVPMSAAFLLLVVTNLGMTIPSAPAYIGVYHALSVATLLLFPSVSRDQALSYAVAIHALAFGGLSLTALFFLWTGHYRLAELIRRSRARMRLL
ncbi:MAG: hypothetical protein CL878_13700 [Dehalococcoidia bacterium]|nr:hypothetical protein [Dehalococcoidia bacterium]